jgi:hypothetical protein
MAPDDNAIDPEVLGGGTTSGFEACPLAPPYRRPLVGLPLFGNEMFHEPMFGTKLRLAVLYSLEVETEPRGLLSLKTSLTFNIGELLAVRPSAVVIWPVTVTLTGSEPVTQMLGGHMEGEIP